MTSNTTLGWTFTVRAFALLPSLPTHRLPFTSSERSALDRMETEAPRVAAAFHTFVIRTLADVLHVADKAICPER